MGNPVSDKLPSDVDSILQDIAQIHGGINYKDIMDFKPSKKDLQGIRTAYADACNTEENSEPFNEALDNIVKIVKPTKELS